MRYNVSPPLKTRYVIYAVMAIRTGINTISIRLLVRYLKINAIIYRYDPFGNLLVSAELLDKNETSVVIARLKDIKGEGK